MDKQRRNELTRLKYKRRISIWVAKLDAYIARNGERIYKPRTIDVIKDNAQYKYKHTGTLCSCYGCSGAYKYNRNKKKTEDRRLLAEYFED